MQHGKLIEVLKRLNSVQIERLGDFVRSPYFNKSRTVSAIFEYLRSLHPDYNDEFICNEAIFKNVSSVKDAGHLENKITRLVELTGKFLSLEISHDKTMEQIGTLKGYKKLHLNKHFESLIHHLRKEMKSESFHDFDYLW